MWDMTERQMRERIVELLEEAATLAVGLGTTERDFALQAKRLMWAARRKPSS